LASLISSIYTNIRSLIIGKKFTPADLGQYTTANKFATMAGSSLSGVLYNVSFPVLSKVQDNNAVLLDAYKRFLSVSAFAIFPLMMLLAGIAEPLIRFLVTDKWLECVPYLQILCFGWIYDCLTKINLNLLYVKGRSDLVLKLEVFKKTIAFTILFISCFMGIIGICVGAAIYNFIAFFCNTYYTKRLLGYGFKEQFLQTLPYLSLSLLVLVLALSICMMELPPVALIALSTAICMAAYFGLAKIFRLSAFAEMTSIIKQILK
ncbi:MAG TPA: flippase, partial [Rikenellaceae bacterium]|nr:flippase [Rikenellaceae bacterium]